MLNLKWLLSLLPPSTRPVIVALLAIIVGLALLRPRPPRPSAAARPAVGAAGAKAESAARPPLSISTVGVLLEFCDGRPRLLPNAVAALRRVAERATVHLVTTLPADSDELEAATLAAMVDGGVFGEGGCDQRRALFCCTEDGRGAICRQLAPSLHLDTSQKVLEYLAPHVPKVVRVSAESAAGPSSAGPSTAAAPIASVASLAAFAGEGS